MTTQAVICEDGKTIEGVLFKDEIKAIIARSRQKHVPDHLEAKWLQPYCVGLTADLGCGAEKVSPIVLGIDKLSPGEIGTFGCMSGRTTVADISADAGDLSFLADETFDSVVSRHCFEHLPDPVATLREWLRIIRKGGLLNLVLPNDEWRDFLNMDKDHKFRCYPKTVTEALGRLNTSGGPVTGSLIENGRMVQPQWSFFAQIRRT
jgi:SAM-dependent methyltransferase